MQFQLYPWFCVILARITIEVLDNKLFQGKRIRSTLTPNSHLLPEDSGTKPMAQVLKRNQLRKYSNSISPDIFNKTTEKTKFLITMQGAGKLLKNNKQ